METFDAVMLIEDGEEHDAEEMLEAWASLIKSGTCWHLQGSYGRTAAHLIQTGIISETGEIL